MKLTDMTEAEIVRIAAEDVMGWKWSDGIWTSAMCGWYKNGGYQQGTFSPLTDANDDVMVLDQYRGGSTTEWIKKDKFHAALQNIWLDRTPNFAWSLCYQVGDYTRAAVAVVLAKKENNDGVITNNRG